MARFALATILGNWVFVELMITKLPHYMLPSFSSLAFLTAGVLSVWIRKQVVPGGVRVAAVVWGLLILVFALLPWAATHFDRHLAAMIFAAFGVIFAVAMMIAWNVRRPAMAASVTGFGMMIAIAILFGVFFPKATFLRIPQDAGERLQALHATDAIMIGFTEPSLAFYQGGTIRPRPDDYLMTQSPADWPNWIVVTSDIYESLPSDRRERLQQIASYPGFNYNIPMRPVTVIVARKRLEK